MNCPVDNTLLQMSERNGVEIDYCPRCRGVWLDRGELDKIIERSSSMGGFAPAAQTYHDDNNSSSHMPHGQHSNHDDDDDDDDHHSSYNSRSNGHQSQNKRKKESFLGDLFDF